MLRGKYKRAFDRGVQATMDGYSNGYLMMPEDNFYGTDAPSMAACWESGRRWAQARILGRENVVNDDDCDDEDDDY